MTAIVLNRLPDDEVKVKHICFFTEPDRLDSRYIVLKEVIEVSVRHPQAPEDATLQVMDTRIVERVNRFSSEAAAYVLLEAAQKSVKHQRD